MLMLQPVQLVPKPQILPSMYLVMEQLAQLVQ